MGTAEFYDIVERFDQVADSLVVHLDDPDGGPGQLWLFVVARAEPPRHRRAATSSQTS